MRSIACRREKVTFAKCGCRRREGAGGDALSAARLSSRVRYSHPLVALSTHATRAAHRLEKRWCARNSRLTGKAVARFIRPRETNPVALTDSLDRCTV